MQATKQVTAGDVVEIMVEKYRRRIRGTAFLSSGQAAEAIGFSEATVKRLSDAGKIHCCRTPGGHRKFSAVDLAAYMNTPHYQNHVDPDSPIPYVLGVDAAATPGDETAVTTLHIQADGSSRVVDQRSIPSPSLSEDYASELDS